MSAGDYLDRLEEAGLDLDERRDAAFFMLGYLQNSQPEAVLVAAEHAIAYRERVRLQKAGARVLEQRLAEQS